MICTQPLHFFAIILAVRLANFIRYKDNKQIQRIDLYLTDLPTNKAIHFTGGLRRLHMLSQRCFEMIRLHTPKPVEPDADAFWKKEAHLEPHQIKYGSLPLSEPFKKPDLLPLPGIAVEIKIQTYSDSERDAIARLTQSQSAESIGSFKIRENDKVGLVMLGSVPDKSAVLDYVDEIIHASIQNPPLDEENAPIFYFFVSCGKPENGGQNLFRKVFEKIGESNLNSRIKIIPFSSQPVAPFFARSDLTITRSGGMTSAEIKALKDREKDNKRILIHSPVKASPTGTKEEIQETLLNGIPLWEEGNAQYLVEYNKVNAEIVTPALAQQELSKFFSG